jgi:TPR repeat protein
MYSKGEGVGRDRNKALELYDRACDMKLEIACKNYSKLRGRLNSTK